MIAKIRVVSEPSFKFQKAVVEITRDISFSGSAELGKSIEILQSVARRAAVAECKKLAEEALK